ncbi:hypothetical protein QCA50_019967 [Cerrena zonata]|uniref:Kinase n=1 Tax=Cerrena zonata TaxID=2478898 RepID=A0AAW0FCP9_9APHY
MSTSSTLNEAGHVPLEAQVGGHKGVMTTEDGSLLIKPALPVEVAFYQSVGTDPAFAPLRPFIPKFYGTLTLEGVVDPEKGLDGGEKPNILDIKLGTVLYDLDATPEKKARMEKTARETTSLETGIRLTGFQVYDLAANVAVNTPREYGKSIKASELIDGIDRFFPVASSSSSPTSDSQAGKETVSPPSSGTGLPARLLLPILEYLREDIAEIREAIADVHMRMVGGSLLIIYEADWERVEEGLKYLEEDGGSDEDEEDDDDDEEAKQRPGPPYAVKVIDFAHTRIVPGEGPDEGVLKGVDTTLCLLDQRIKQVKAAIA